ncbi:MAG: hypothetical protein H7A23_16245 [Leptospiraceae bacterium]|nr:hypothetical protein [Leptospiraceae bacterium]MCP5496098.1 hypothetical protein [Leptospiraceae bacterium]
MNPKIFVSYNPGVKIEESTALRLQTISSLYDVTVYLPDRLGTKQLKESTKDRILNSNIFVMFSTKKLSNSVKSEADFALANDKQVIILYDHIIGKNINTAKIKDKNFIEIEYDPERENHIDILNKVLNASNKKGSDGKMLSAIIGVGLGLLLMWYLSDDEKTDNR